MSITQKNGRFYLRKVFDGKQQTIPLGDKKRIATERAAGFITMVKELGNYENARAKWDGKPIVIPGDNPTAEEISTLYREFWSGQTDGPLPQTIELNTARLRLFFKRAGAKRVKDLDKNTLAAFWFGEKTRTPATVRTFASAKGAAASIFTPAALEFYATRGFPISNPFSGVRCERPKPVPYRPFSASLGKTIFEDCQKELSASDSMMIIMAQMIGMRLSEIEQARPEWFSIRDEKTAVVDISPTATFMPKAGKSGHVPFDRAIFDLLLKLRADSGSEFFVPSLSPKDERRLRERAKHVNKWLKGKGVTNAKPLHGLRKQFGSLIYLNHGLLEAAAMLRNTVAVCSGYYAGIESNPTAMITSTFEAPATVEESFAASLGLTVEELRARLTPAAPSAP